MLNVLLNQKIKFHIKLAKIFQAMANEQTNKAEKALNTLKQRLGL